MPDDSNPAAELGSPANDELYYLVMRLARSFGRACDDIAWREGITAADVNILLVLGEGDPMSSAQIARRAFITPQASHQLVTRLTARGLLQTGAHPSNRRVRLVSLTEAGWELLERTRHDLRDVQNRAMADLPQRDRDRLRTHLLRVAERLQGGWFGDVVAEAAAAERRAGRANRPTTTDDD